MKMSATDKASLLGGIFLILIMIIQFYADHRLESNFDEFQEKRVGLAKRNFVDAGFSESQADAIAGNIREEVSSLKSTMFFHTVTQSCATTMSCLIVLMLMTWAIKKPDKTD